jgi:tetratricopeptide (TPR) repeat protein
MKRFCSVSFFTFLPLVFVFAQPLPDYFLALRDAVYAQELGASEIALLYVRTRETAQQNLSGRDLYILYSRCEYMVGHAYEDEGRKSDAASHYAEGIRWAEIALENGESSEAYQMLAENISRSCSVRSTAYVMSNGLKVEKYAKKALEKNSRNAAAQIMIASRWIYAPAPFNNIKKGIQMMEEVLGASDPDKDDAFNIYYALGYAYTQQKKYRDARPWLLKALEIYPTNKYALERLALG